MYLILFCINLPYILRVDAGTMHVGVGMYSDNGRPSGVKARNGCVIHSFTHRVSQYLVGIRPSEFIHRNLSSSTASAAMSDPSSPPEIPYKAYVPRRQRSIRPDRPLPPPPPEEDVPAVNAFERIQGYTSPPSPPPPVSPIKPVEKQLPSPPSTAPLEHADQQRQRASSSSSATVPPPNSAPLADSARHSKAQTQTSAAHLHPYHSTLPTSSDPPTVLTPLRAHYLKKTLVSLQVSHELALITDPVLGANALGLLGDPFVLPPQARQEALQRVSEIARAEGQVGDLPFLRFMFHQFLLPFPFLTAAPPTFWSAKVQPFLSSFLSTTGISAHATQTEQEREVVESLMSKDELKEVQERRKLWVKVEKHLALMFGLGIKLTNGEEVVRIGQAELKRLEALQEERKRKWMEKHGGRQPGEAHATGFEVNVIGVRLVMEKGRVRNRSHEVNFLLGQVCCGDRADNLC